MQMQLSTQVINYLEFHKGASGHGSWHFGLKIENSFSSVKLVAPEFHALSPCANQHVNKQTSKDLRNPNMIFESFQHLIYDKRLLRMAGSFGAGFDV